MGTEKDRGYDAEQGGYGAADDEVDEETPAQEQQQPPAHERDNSRDEDSVARGQQTGRTR